MNVSTEQALLRDAGKVLEKALAVIAGRLIGFGRLREAELLLRQGQNFTTLIRDAHNWIGKEAQRLGEITEREVKKKEMEEEG